MGVRLSIVSAIAKEPLFRDSVSTIVDPGNYVIPPTRNR